MACDCPDEDAINCTIEKSAYVVGDEVFYNIDTEHVSPCSCECHMEQQPTPATGTTPERRE